MLLAGVPAGPVCECRAALESKSGQQPTRLPHADPQNRGGREAARGQIGQDEKGE